MRQTEREINEVRRTDNSHSRHTEAEETNDTTGRRRRRFAFFEVDVRLLNCRRYEVEQSQLEQWPIEKA